MLGLCICYHNNNYGTMLQAYATIVAIEKIGVPYEIIVYRKKLAPWFVLKSLPRLLNPILLSEKIMVLQKKWYLKRNKTFARNSAIKDSAFKNFRLAKFKKLAPVCYGFKELQSKAKQYAACLVGSDQLWSPSGLPTNFYNLQFVPDSVRKISYAASFGVSSIPFFQKQRTKKFLERIDYLSVRENSAQKIVCALTGRTAKLVVDPTLLLSSEEWAKEIPVSNAQKEPYIFAYFLGKNPHHRKVVNDFSKKIGMKLVVLRHMDQFVLADESFGDEAPYDVGPSEFLNLIRHAAYVCTDSFHGMVFSVIHHKSFMIFERYGASESKGNSRNSRIDSFCEHLGLWKRRYCNDMCIEDKMNADIDYSDVDKRLNALRIDSEEFLREALSIKNQ